MAESALAVTYVYCGCDDREWRLVEGTEVLAAVTPAALYGLVEAGVVRREQSVQPPGEEPEGQLSDWVAVLKRRGYGQLLRKLTSHEGRSWYYEGRSGAIQGPFSGKQMLQWFNGGYLYEQMALCTTPDPSTVPQTTDFVALEDWLTFMSQPIYCEEGLRQQRPLKDLRQIRCLEGSCHAYIGSLVVISAELPELPVMRESQDCEAEASERREVVEAVQGMRDVHREDALRLFCSKQREWYYLGQRSSRTIHGPHDGRTMFSWFLRGWLSLELLICDGTGDSAGGQLNRFTPLKDLLKKLHLRTPPLEAGGDADLVTGTPSRF